jgi:hypothetical protein
VSDDRDTPLIWNETVVTITDLNKKTTEIFFYMRLDTPGAQQPVGQINFDQDEGARVKQDVIARLDLITQYPRAEAMEPEGRGVLDPPLSRRMTG